MASSFGSLPTELQEQVIKYITPPTLLSFACTSKLSYILSQNFLASFKRYGQLSSASPPMCRAQYNTLNPENDDALPKLIYELMNNLSLCQFVLHLRIGHKRWRQAFMDHESAISTDDTRHFRKRIATQWKTAPWCPADGRLQYFYQEQLKNAGLIHHQTCDPQTGVSRDCFGRGYQTSIIAVLTMLAPCMSNLRSVTVSAECMEEFSTLIRAELLCLANGHLEYRGAFAALEELEVINSSSSVRMFRLLPICHLPALRILRLNASHIDLYGMDHLLYDRDASYLNDMLRDQAPLRILELEPCYPLANTLMCLLSHTKPLCLETFRLKHLAIYIHARNPSLRHRDVLSNLLQQAQFTLKSLTLRMCLRVFDRNGYPSLEDEDGQGDFISILNEAYSFAEGDILSLFTALSHIEVDAHVFLDGYGLLTLARTPVPCRCTSTARHLVGLKETLPDIASRAREPPTSNLTPLSELLPRALKTLKIACSDLQKPVMLQQLQSFTGGLELKKKPLEFPALERIELVPVDEGSKDNYEWQQYVWNFS